MPKLTAITKKEKSFLLETLPIAIPIILQGFISRSLNFVDILMIGELGDTAVASVGLGNQFSFIFEMIVMGLSGSAAIFTAQFWGKKDIKSIKSFLALNSQLVLFLSILITAVTYLFPENIIGFYSHDPDIIATGSQYLKIISIGYVFTAFTRVFAFSLRSIRVIQLPFYASTIGFGLNTVLNYCLIFGNVGFPEWGVKGAAVATAIARSVECLIILGYVYFKDDRLRIGVTEFLYFNMEHFVTFKRVALPGVLQCFGWVFGVAVYNKLIAQLGTSSLAAYSVADTIEKLALNFCVGLGITSSIVLGNLIGEKKYDKVMEDSKKFIVFGAIVTIVLSVIIIVTRGWVLQFFNISVESKVHASNLLFVMSFLLVAKFFNILFNVGLFRSGGDTRYIMFVDMSGVWFVGVPLGYLAVYLLKLPVQYVVLLISMEEIVKMLLGIKRFISRKWIKNLTEKVSD